MGLKIMLQAIGINEKSKACLLSSFNQKWQDRENNVICFY